jgi:uncharacterized Tic20 family protein
MATPDFTGGADTSRPAGSLRDDEKQMAMMCHMLALAGVLACGLAMPLGPFLVWYTKRSTSPFVDENGKEAVNFQLNILIYVLFTLLFVFISDFFLIIPIGIAIYGGVMAIMAGMRAGEGQSFKYPGVVRLIK